MVIRDGNTEVIVVHQALCRTHLITADSLLMVVFGIFLLSYLVFRLILDTGKCLIHSSNSLSSMGLLNLEEEINRPRVNI